MEALFVIVAIGLGAIGFLESTQATFGVALIGCGCICAAIGRIGQAQKQQKELLKELDQQHRRTDDLMKWIYSLQTGRDFKRPAFAEGDIVNLKAGARQGKKSRQVEIWDSLGEEAQVVTRLANGAPVKVLEDRETVLQVQTMGGRFTGWVDVEFIHDPR